MWRPVNSRKKFQLIHSSASIKCKIFLKIWGNLGLEFMGERPLCLRYMYHRKILCVNQTYFWPIFQVIFRIWICCKILVRIKSVWMLEIFLRTPCYYLTYGKHIPCFYWVIETWVEVWENEKWYGNTSHRRVFPQHCRVLPSFHKCFYNSIEHGVHVFYFF